MKTFKMMYFEFDYNDETIQIPLEDGILINQENSYNVWIIEAFIKKEYSKHFPQLLESKEIFNARAVISFPDNDPAHFALAVYAVEPIKDAYVSVLFKGTVAVKRQHYAEDLLEQLLADGLSGDELQHQFKLGLHYRPPLRPTDKKTEQADV
ncbi:MAG: hypothetical protein KIG60_05070 [Caryophanon sp.]|nr:hypothetical protein [Caryophanon sp.]